MFTSKMDLNLIRVGYIVINIFEPVISQMLPCPHAVRKLPFYEASLFSLSK